LHAKSFPNISVYSYIVNEILDYPFCLVEIPDYCSHYAFHTVDIIALEENVYKKKHEKT